MNCQTFEQYRVDYLEGTLSPAHTQDVDAHLQQCVQCRKMLAQEQAISAELKRWPAVQCPESVLERVWNQIEQEHPRLSWHERLRWWFAWRANEHVWEIGATATVVIFLVMAAVFFQGGGSPPVQPASYTAEEVEQAKRDIELTLAYVNYYTQQTEHIVERQLAATRIAVTQPVRTIFADRIQSTRSAIRRPLETQIKETFTSLINGG